MNRANELRDSFSNVAYELEHDITNIPVLKDTSKPFNMSDYIKPVRVTDEDFEEEKIAEEITPIEDVAIEEYEIYEPLEVIASSEEDEIIALTEELLLETFDDMTTFEGDEHVAYERKENTRTDKIINKNIKNLENNVVKSQDKIEGIKKATNQFKQDNKEILTNAPEISVDVASMVASNTMPISNASKKVNMLRKMVEMEIEKRRKQQRQEKKASTLLGNYFLK